MNKQVALLAFLVFSLCFLGLLGLQIGHASPYDNINATTAYNMITNGSFPDLVVLDVRTQSEYDSGHIYGAIWIPHTELPARINELSDHEDHEIIVYCLSGGRSATASGILDSHGFTKVYNMLGGITAWQSAGYPIWIATVHNVDTAFNYDTIQAAIDAPQTLNGHTILVDAGTYYEHVIVNKSVGLIGENELGTTIDGGGTGSVVEIATHNVAIINFAIQNFGHTWGNGGVRIGGSATIENITVRNNSFSDGWCGIFVNLGSKFSKIENNLFSALEIGIFLLPTSPYVCHNNIIANNNLTENSYGIVIDHEQSQNNTVSRNNFKNNENGIVLNLTSNNLVLENELHNNSVGVLVDRASDNTLYHNNFFNNTQHVHIQISGYANVWDASYPSGGNFWSDYDSSDLYGGPNQNVSGGDGIGDIPYIFDANNTDRYPLIDPYDYIPSPDVNADGIINILDILLCAVSFGSQPGDSNWNPKVDLDQNEIINILDILAIAVHFGETA